MPLLTRMFYEHTLTDFPFGIALAAKDHLDLAARVEEVYGRGLHTQESLGGVGTPETVAVGLGDKAYLL